MSGCEQKRVVRVTSWWKSGHTLICFFSDGAKASAFLLANDESILGWTMCWELASEDMN